MVSFNQHAAPAALFQQLLLDKGGVPHINPQTGKTVAHRTDILFPSQPGNHQRAFIRMLAISLLRMLIFGCGFSARGEQPQTGNTEGADQVHGRGFQQTEGDKHRPASGKNRPAGSR